LSKKVALNKNGFPGVIDNEKQWRWERPPRAFSGVNYELKGQKINRISAEYSDSDSDSSKESDLGPTRCEWEDEYDRILAERRKKYKLPSWARYTYEVQTQPHEEQQLDIASEVPTHVRHSSLPYTTV
jgi:hypothetical protein